MARVTPRPVLIGGDYYAPRYHPDCTGCAFQHRDALCDAAPPCYFLPDSSRNRIYVPYARADEDFA